ncbi:helix-turn-helix domain-containing protein [Allokutzneria albata]|uniref:AraC-type DNA-binding protein n=1 Tax=Allokutzneria albata TaxID=211114 RepID=A0A1G9TSP9_ALLAB|nr:AraC family transcriptional regulator [Allokutzneria albata]SDM50464.1 AraC-type DNA-binding protein [Allokutzneria albata]
MLSVVELAAHSDLVLSTASCQDDHEAWSPAESSGDWYRLVLVRRGRFRRHVRGLTMCADPTTGYVSAPAQEERFAHPAGSDACTSISLSPAFWQSLAGDGAPPLHGLPVDAELDLAHRRVLASGEKDYGLVERLLDLVGTALRRVPDTPRWVLRDAGLVDRARAAILDDAPEAADLMSLARLLGVSPYRLSRVFSRSAGMSITRFRNTVRVRRALDRLEGGDDSIAAIAADLGFTDQAHLSRTVREHVGQPPSALRRLLRPQKCTSRAGTESRS